jgi:hypothetical protein
MTTRRVLKLARQLYVERVQNLLDDPSDWDADGIAALRQIGTDLGLSFDDLTKRLRAIEKR